MNNQAIMEKALANIKAWFEENEQRIVEVSDQIWNFAETKFQEFESSEVLKGVFREFSFEVKDHLVDGMPTAFTAEWSNGEGPTIAMLGEYDALPGLGNDLVPRKSPNGKNGHGCGHNLLGVGSMAAAISAAHTMKALGITGRIKYFGCPAEEGGSGKVFMVRDGIFKGIDAIVRWHPINITYVDMSSSLSVISIKYEFHGKSAHAGTAPHLGRSALDGVILTDIGANYLREHMPTTVRLHSVITNGGKAPNIVPDLAEIWYYIRAPKITDADDILKRLDKIAQGAAMATETTVTQKIVSANSATLPNKALCERMLVNMNRVGPPAFTEEDYAFAKQINEQLAEGDKAASLRMFGIHDPSWGKKDLYDVIYENMNEGTITPYSTDSGDVSWQAPMCQCFVASQTIGSKNHSWEQVVCSGMGIGHRGMLCAGKIIAMTALDILSDPDLLATAKAEYDKVLESSKYICPIPADMVPGVQ